MVQMRFPNCPECDHPEFDRPDKMLRVASGNNVGDTAIVAARRRAQIEPPSPPAGHHTGTHLVGRCEPKCSLDKLYMCKTEKACTATEVQGRWTPHPAGLPKPKGAASGYCSNGCSEKYPSYCKTEAQCTKVGGVYKTKTRLGMPSVKVCDVTNAPCDAALLLAECGGTNVDKVSQQGLELCDDKCGQYISQNYEHCSAHPPKGVTKAQWISHFGPIVTMCKSFREEPSLERCARQMEQATNELNAICCTNNTHCASNHGSPTKCIGACADAFLPFFEECGAVFLRADKSAPSALGRFYHTCTANGKQDAFQNPKLCVANNGNAPFWAIEFRKGCSVWIKYINAQTHSAEAEFVQLVAVGVVSIDELLQLAKTVCGKLTMVQRIAEDFSGILALAGIDEKGDKLTITVNHPTTGNTQVEVTNTAANKRTVKAGWKSSFDVNVFNPEHCPAH